MRVSDGASEVDLDPRHSVLAVFAHPDDESLAAGGLLARQAAGGASTAVVTATWAACSTRTNELAEALRILGAGPPRMLGHADARVPESAPGCRRLVDVPLEESGGQLLAHLHELRPDVVLTHDVHGGVTGHEDHVRTHAMVMWTVRECGYAPRLLLATHPHAARSRLHGIIEERKMVHTVPDEDVALTLDVTPWLEQKVGAVLAHRSEVERGALPWWIASLSPEDRETFLGIEWYASAHPTSS